MSLEIRLGPTRGVPTTLLDILRRSFLRKYLTAESHSQKTPSYSFDSVLNSSLVWVGSL